MRKTLTLTVSEELGAFIDHQPGEADPSAFIAQLFHQEMQKEGFQMNSNTQAKLRDEVIIELELMADENTPAAG